MIKFDGDSPKKNEKLDYHLLSPRELKKSPSPSLEVFWWKMDLFSCPGTNWTVLSTNVWRTSTKNEQKMEKQKLAGTSSSVKFLPLESYQKGMFFLTTAKPWQQSSRVFQYLCASMA